MRNSIKTYRVGLLLDKELVIPDYELSVGNQKRSITFFNHATNGTKYCDLVITDKEPVDLSAIPTQEKDSHGVVVVVNKFSNPKNENDFLEVFFNASNIKYRSISDVNVNSIKRIINAEFIKELVKENKLGSLIFLLSRYTRKELLANIRGLWFLLVPFLAILVFYAVKSILLKNGYSLSFLCCFVGYDPDCKTDWAEELKLFALIYALFNLFFYCDYILSVFDNINNDVFEYSKWNKAFNKPLQFLCLIALFLSSVTLLKSLFVFKSSFAISTDHIEVNIDTIFNNYLPFLKDNLLIVYFLALDFFLLMLTLNFFTANKRTSNSFTSARQLIFLKDARKDFIISVSFTLMLILVFAALPATLFDDPKSNLAYQLVFLQLFYLGINIHAIFSDFKFK